MAMGGADVGWAQGPLESMGDNPAGLGFLPARELDFGAVGGNANGQFSKQNTDSRGNLSDTPRGLPEGAFGMQLGQTPIYAGLSFIPESVLLADWGYLDPGTVSYGNQTDKSEILVLRSALGLSLKLNSKLSIGASFGAIYNKNELVTPYIFQNLNAPDAGADGVKTLLDLNTSGWGWNAQIGMLYQPINKLQFGLTFQNKYRVTTTGSASGNAGVQFGHPGDSAYSFNYRAEVDNNFPYQVSLGSSWEFLPKWRLAAQVDWIDWADAFNTMPVKLTDGTGKIITGALGTHLQDNVPLNWKNEFVYRVGLEYAPIKNLFLRAGYCYGNSPVPDTTLTPMTAAIIEHTITAGMGYRWRACEFDLAYQCGLPATQHIGTSALRDGEYSNSSITVFENVVALTMKYSF
jgi:long-chain fatty acid transport protein